MCNRRGVGGLVLGAQEPAGEEAVIEVEVVGAVVAIHPEKRE